MALLIYLMYTRVISLVKPCTAQKGIKMTFVFDMIYQHFMKSLNWTYIKLGVINIDPLRLLELLNPS